MHHIQQQNIYIQITLPPSLRTTLFQKKTMIKLIQCNQLQPLKQLKNKTKLDVKIFSSSTSFVCCKKKVYQPKRHFTNYNNNNHSTHKYTADKLIDMEHKYVNVVY